jgi:hypothetical protein
MPDYKTKKFQKSLKKKGFVEEKKHHTYYHFIWNGKITNIHTYTGHGERDFDSYLFNKRENQIQIQNKQDMLDFYNCPMSKEDYSNYLISIGKIDPLE